MTNFRKLYELVHLAQRALSGCHYRRAEKLIEQILVEAQKANEDEIFELAEKALTDCRRYHFLNALHELKRIDPIQAQRKELS